MRALVTGAAGFIGSSLVDELLERGDRVVGLDAFTENYARAQKERNLAGAVSSSSFELVTADLEHADLAALLDEVEVVFHLAAQPGVRDSWDASFERYVSRNITATQRLLEAARRSSLERFVYASSSSVYGAALDWPTPETATLTPFSPYGVTKLAAEHLCSVYAANFRVPTVSLRYFTVYGPRQRPDMAVYRLVRAADRGEPFPMFGSGDQVRDLTYVDDVVEANLAAVDREAAPGTAINIAGGSSTSLVELIERVQRETGRTVVIDHRPDVAGDVARTGGDIERARSLLGWTPRVDLPTGVARQVAWQRAEAHRPEDANPSDRSAVLR